MCHHTVVTCLICWQCSWLGALPLTSTGSNAIAAWWWRGTSYKMQSHSWSPHMISWIWIWGSTQEQKRQFIQNLQSLDQATHQLEGKDHISVSNPTTSNDVTRSDGLLKDIQVIDVNELARREQAEHTQEIEALFSAPYPKDDKKYRDCNICRYVLFLFHCSFCTNDILVNSLRSEWPLSTKVQHYNATSKQPTKPSLSSGLLKMVSRPCYQLISNAIEKKKHVSGCIIWHQHQSATISWQPPHTNRYDHPILVFCSLWCCYRVAGCHRQGKVHFTGAISC